MHLTDLVVKSLPLQESGQKDYTDDTLAGLTLRVGKRTKTFMLLVGSGKARKRHTLGKYPYVSLQDARKKARVIIGQREQAPQDDHAPEVAFDDALDKFLTAYAEKNKESTVYETTRLLNRHLKPTLSGKGLREAKKWRLVEILDEIEKVSGRSRSLASHNMNPDFIAGVEYAKTVLRQLSVQAPQNKDEERIWSIKTDVMKECVEAACRCLDEDVRRGTM